MRFIKILMLHILMVIYMGKGVYAGTIPPSFLDSVVAIYKGAPDPSGSFIGTGFLVKKTNGADKVYLVTAKHVTKDQNIPINVRARFNLKSGTGSNYINISKEKWTEHPSEGIDVAVMGFTDGFLDGQNIKRHPFTIENHSLTLPQMSKKGISEGDFVYVLGFPMGLVDNTEDPTARGKEYVIVRSGSIARLRDLIDGKDKSSTFLIDTFVFPGNSGGPVILRPEGMYIEGTKPINDSYLIGLVSSYHPYHERLINSQTKKDQMVLTQNSGLTYVIPVDYILLAIEAAEKKAP